MSPPHPPDLYAELEQLAQEPDAPLHLGVGGFWVGIVPASGGMAREVGVRLREVGVGVGIELGRTVGLRGRGERVLGFVGGITRR